MKKYDQIWKRIEQLLKIKFGSKPAYGDDEKYIKTKVKTYGDSVIINFHNKKIPKQKAPCKCLSIIMLNSVIKAKKKYYPQTLLEECKYEQERIKIEKLFDDDLEKSRSDSDSNDETESDIDKDESDEQFVNNNKSLHLLNRLCLIMCINHTLLGKVSPKDVGFYLYQSVSLI